MIKFKKGDYRNFKQLQVLDSFLIGHKGFIAGGCFKNIFNSEKIKDIDMYFRNERDFLEAKAYYQNLIIEEPVNYKKSYENKNVWAVLDVKTGIRIELIQSIYGEPKEVLSNFDFSITHFAYYLEEVDEGKHTVILYNENFFEHLHMKRLVIEQQPEELIMPLSTFNRAFKYTKYGYNLCRESKEKVVVALHSLPDGMQMDELGMSLYAGLD